MDMMNNFSYMYIKLNASVSTEMSKPANMVIYTLMFTALASNFTALYVW
jgi:hypothetical protein